MNTKSKWMVTFSSGDYHDWIKDVAEETGIPGSRVVEELIERCRTKDEKEFKRTLKNATKRIQVEALEVKKQELELQIEKLRSESGLKVGV